MMAQSSSILNKIVLLPDAATRGVLSKKVFLEISQNLQASGLQPYLKKCTGVFM